MSLATNFKRCTHCDKTMTTLWYMNIEIGYGFEYKGFRCDSCGSTYPYEIADSLESASSEDSPSAFVMNVWASDGYADFRFPRACPFCETVLFWILANSQDNPNLALFEGLECLSCKSYFDKTVLSKLKDYIDEDDEYGWRRTTPEEAEEYGLNWEAAVAKYEQLAGLQKHSTES